MSVKLKTLLISVITVFLVIVFTTGIFYYIILSYITRLEDKSIGNSFEILDSIIKREENNLKRTSLDWANWDETYNFLLNKNEEYIKSNLRDKTFERLNLNFMFFLDSKGNMFYESIYNLKNDEKDILIDKIINKGTNSHVAVENSNVKSGIITISDKLFIIVISPISTSDGMAKSNGNLIVGRYVDKELLNYINNINKDKVIFKDKQIPKEFLDKTIIDKNNEFIMTHKQLKDINEDESVTAIVSIKRDDYNMGIYYFKIFVSVFIGVLTIILFLYGSFVNNYILKRLKKIDEFIEKVTKTKDTSARIDLSGNDEFNKIANSTNKMLEEIESSNKDIKEMDQRFRLIMEATKDGYVDFYIKDKKMYINPEWKSELGYKSKDNKELFNEHCSKIHPDCLEIFKNKYFEFTSDRLDYYNDTYRMLGKSGEIIWVLARGKIVERDKDGSPSRIISILSNITDRKKYEEEILFLSYSDKLTSLKNRAYMEKQFEQLDSNREDSYFIIMGDINGLRLINDTLGPKVGDKLIYAVSSILKKSCSYDDILSRWGGDEFVILIKNKDLIYVYKLIKNIREACEEIEGSPMKISIALGYAEKKKENMNSEYVMNLAEKRMYRNKLMENKSSRSAIISSLLRTLHEKHSETEEHTMRIKKMSLKLGKKLGLSQDKLDELELLALLHDIGKIGIPEQILLKPDKLTEKEWSIMKTHTEIGYRIAKSTLELEHIAEPILSHHEKYDGTGYPNGLKREQIPLLARIITIVDSFDVMTHKRVYKEAKDKLYAVEELKRCSGTQFDPFIVSEFMKLLEKKEVYEESVL